MLKSIKSKNPKTTVVVTSNTITEALEMYNKGADYVMLPQVVAGADLSKLIHDGKRKDFSEIKKEQVEHLKYIRDIL